MTTDIEMTTDEMQPISQSPPSLQPSGLGARLRAARQAMHLSEKDAAARLHLAPRFIVIMENEDFESGLPATFMRGYVRSYGRLLAIPRAELDAAIEKLGVNIAPPLPPVKPQLHAPFSNKNESYVQWLTYLILFVLVLLVAVWWNSHPRTLNKNKPLPTTAVPGQSHPILSTPAPLPAAASSLPVNTPITAQPPINSVAKPLSPAPKNTPPIASATGTNELAAPTASSKQDKNVETQQKMVLPEPDLNTIDY